MIPIEDVLPFKKVEVNEFLKNKIMNGQKLQNRLKQPILFTYQKKALALYQEDGEIIRPWKMFLS